MLQVKAITDKKKSIPILPHKVYNMKVNVSQLDSHQSDQVH